MSSGSRVSSNTTPGLKAVFATANIHIIRKTPEPIRTFFCGISHSSRERLMQDQNIKVLLHNYLDLKIVWKSTHEKRKIHPWEEENPPMRRGKSVKLCNEKHAERWTKKAKTLPRKWALKVSFTYAKEKENWRSQPCFISKFLKLVSNIHGILKSKRLGT